MPASLEVPLCCPKSILSPKGGSETPKGHPAEQGPGPRCPRRSQGAGVGDEHPAVPSAQGSPGLPAPQTGGIRGCGKCVATETDAEPLVGTKAQGTPGETRCPWAGRMLPMGSRRCHQLHRDLVPPLPGARVRGHVRDDQSIPAAYRGCRHRGASLAREPELPQLQKPPCLQPWCPQILAANIPQGSCKVLMGGGEQGWPHEKAGIWGLYWVYPSPTASGWGCSSPFSLSFIINHTFGLPISFPKAFKSASKLPSDPSLCLSNQGASGRERNYSLLI